MPTYNRSATLRRTLEALVRVEYSAMSVLVVDNASVPEHATANRSITEELNIPYLYVEPPNRGPGPARNRGIETTESDLVVFLDDDCAPASDWLRQLVEPFYHGEERLGGIGGGVRSQPPHNWVSRFCAAAEYSTGVQPVFTNAATANACFPRRVLEEVGGFDEGFTEPGGDDVDLSRRIREAHYELRYLPEAVVFHAEIDSFHEFISQLFRRGLGEARSKQKEGRIPWLLMRTALFPLFCARRALQTWKVTAGRASPPIRAAYAAMESAGALSFVAGSAVGVGRMLVRR